MSDFDIVNLPSAFKSSDIDDYEKRKKRKKSSSKDFVLWHRFVRFISTCTFTRRHYFTCTTDLISLHNKVRRQIKGVVGIFRRAGGKISIWKCIFALCMQWSVLSIPIEPFRNDVYILYILSKSSFTGQRLISYSKTEDEYGTCRKSCFSFIWHLYEM